MSLARTPLAGLLLLALAVVVVAATGAGSGAPAAPEQGALAASAILRAGFILLGVGAAGIAVLIAWTLWGAGRRPEVVDRAGMRRYLLISLIQAWIVILILWLRPELQKALFRHVPNQPAAGGSLPPLPGSGPPGVEPASVDLLTAVIVAAVLFSAAYFLLRGFRRRPRRPARDAARRAVEAAVDESLHDLDDPDLRRAVIRAYSRMEAALARAGLPRRAPETSLEYMSRALAWLGAPSLHVRRLTELFNLARFSPHPIGAEMKAEAVAALDGVRADLALQQRRPA